ncbi:hypothetical protein Tco_1233071 [Tanacetum coccineum]
MMKLSFRHLNVLFCSLILKVTNEVRIYQKSQENSQKRANTNTRNGRAQKKPEMQSQSQEKSKSQSCGQPPVNLGQQKQGSTREAGFCTNCSHKRSTYVSITDCQAGNPCEFNCDPRAIINPPIIKRMYGQDQKELGQQGKVWKLHQEAINRAYTLTHTDGEVA